jgi:hypothetical protein
VEISASEARQALLSLIATAGIGNLRIAPVP